MPAELVKKTLKGSDFSKIDWQKEFKFPPDQLFTITIIEAEVEPTEAITSVPDNIVVVDGNEYEIEMSPDLSMAEINAKLGGFDFLKDEPDLYSIDDLKKRYV